MDRDVVVVTGASAGVGRAVAREFRQRTRVELLANGEALVVPTDVSHAGAVEPRLSGRPGRRVRVARP